MSHPVEEPTEKRGRARSTGLVITAALVAFVTIGLVLFGDVDDLGDALGSFRWSYAIPILGLILAGYFIRFLRWELYLKQLAVPKLPVATSALIFLSGFSMAATPGKVGEVVKCVVLRRYTGTPVSRTSAIVLAERVTDVIAMLVLAAIGLVQFEYGRPFLAAAFAAMAASVFVLQRPELLQRTIAFASRLPVIGRFTQYATAFFGASEALLRPRQLVAGSVLGFLAWGAECVALFVVLLGLGVPGSWHLLLVAVFVMAVSTLLGAVSMLPGGLGVADASVATMLVVLLDGDVMTRGIAAAAALLIRFATLWFGTLIGLASLGVLQLMQRRGSASLVAAGDLERETAASSG